MLALRAALDGLARQVVNHNILDRVQLCCPAFYDVENILFVNRIVLQDMLTDLADAFLYISYLVLIAQDADHVTSGHNAHLRVERTYHLQVYVVYPVEHYRINVLKYNMLFYHLEVQNYKSFFIFQYFLLTLCRFFNLLQEK